MYLRDHGGAKLNTSDLADLSAIILLEEYKENVSVHGRLDSDASPVLRGSSSSLAVSANKSLVIPNEVLQLSDEGLRKKLLSLGEKPGPICDSTRLAYQSYSDPSRWIYKLSFVTCGGWGGGTGRASWGDAGPVGGCCGLVLAVLVVELVGVVLVVELVGAVLVVELVGVVLVMELVVGVVLVVELVVGVVLVVELIGLVLVVEVVGEVLIVEQEINSFDNMGCCQENSLLQSIEQALSALF